jgi:predicted nucleic-acid-binding protein
LKALDTSVLVRYYTADDTKQHAAAVAVLKHEDALFVPKTVVQELWWVLTRAKPYQFPDDKVGEVIAHLAGLGNIVLEDASAIAAALKYRRQGISFADALHLASSAGCTQLLTFDTRLKSRVAKSRLTPACATPV